MQKITPCVWLNGKAKEAIDFYTSVFKNSKTISVTALPPNPSGDGNIVATFQIEGQEFTVLDGGPQFTLTPAISFIVNCETQEEVDYYWQKLAAGGQEIHCGWVTDKFGVSWQIVPTALPQLMKDKDPAKQKRVFDAMLQMAKLDIKKLQEAAAGK